MNRSRCSLIKNQKKFIGLLNAMINVFFIDYINKYNVGI